MSHHRTLAQLIDREDPFLPILEQWIEAARGRGELLPVSVDGGERTLLALQVTTRSALGHSAWLEWALNGDLDGIYASMRWPGWEEEVAALPGDRVIHIYPPLFAAGEPVAKRSRRPVPIEEIWSLQR
jgi:hypothetical protein